MDGTEHIAHHSVTTEEVEQIFANDPIDFLHGYTPNLRVVLVVWTLRDDAIRPITETGCADVRHRGRGGEVAGRSHRCRRGRTSPVHQERDGPAWHGPAPHPRSPGSRRAQRPKNGGSTEPRPVCREKHIARGGSIHRRRSRVRPADSGPAQLEQAIKWGFPVLFTKECWAA